MTLDQDIITTTKQDPRTKIRDLIQDSNKLVAKLIAACCQADRSESMTSLQHTFAIMIEKDSLLNAIELADAYIEYVNSCGADIGRLYATCCTPTRVKIYQNLLKNLNYIFINCWEIKGHSAH